MPTTQNQQTQSTCRCRPADVIETACELIEESMMPSVSIPDLVERLERDFNDPFIPGTSVMAKYLALANLLRDHDWSKKRIRMRKAGSETGTTSLNRWSPPPKLATNLDVYATRKQQ